MSDQDITTVLSSDFLDHYQIKNIYQICLNFRELMSQQIAMNLLIQNEPLNQGTIMPDMALIDGFQILPRSA